MGGAPPPADAGSAADAPAPDTAASDATAPDTTAPDIGASDLAASDLAAGDAAPADAEPGSDSWPVPPPDGAADSGKPPSCAPGELLCAASGKCCKAGETCFPFGCASSGGTCSDDSECLNDSYCYLSGGEGLCVPYGKGPGGSQKLTCEKVVPPGVFFPSLQCQWTGPPPGDPFPNNRQVLGTPLVANFGMLMFSSVGGHIVFVSYSGLDGGLPSASSGGIIRILDGATCEQLYTLGDHAVVGGSTPAIGDLDLDPDGRPEIVALAEGGGVVAFRYDDLFDEFALLWHSTAPDGVTKDTFGASEYRWAGPSLADLTGDAHPEVLFEGVVYDHNGVKITNGLGWIGYGQGIWPIVADVDVDGEPEVVYGTRAHRYDAGTKTLVAESYAASTTLSGYTAVADFGAYGAAAGLPPDAAELAVVQNGMVSVHDLTGATIFGPVAIPGGGTGGPPTIADFDGDGMPEVAAAAMGSYSVFDPGCAGAPPGCWASGVLWSQTSQDYSSSKTGSSVFDFEADGQAEAVYGDECFTRVYDGATGEVLFSGPRASCTWHENPVVADVDGDYRSEVVVGSNENCSISCPALDPIFPGLRCDEDAECAGKLCAGGFCRCEGPAGCPVGYTCGAMLAGWEDGLGKVCRASHAGKTSGIRVFRDLKDRWVHSRAIWNQHAYAVTNVGDGGVVPPMAESVPNWKIPGLNNFRQNAPGLATPLAAPDLTIKPAEPPAKPLACGAGGSVMVTFMVCNRGLTAVAPGVKVEVFAGEPGDTGAPLCAALTPGFVSVASCAPVSCNFAAPGQIPAKIWAAVDGTSPEQGEYLECVEANNAGFLEGAACPW